MGPSVASISSAMLPAFSGALARCPKCTEVLPSLYGAAGGGERCTAAVSGCSAGRVEHLHRLCRCGFSRTEAVATARQVKEAADVPWLRAQQRILDGHGLTAFTYATEEDEEADVNGDGFATATAEG